jgi:putative ABC transport system permease protein
LERGHRLNIHTDEPSTEIKQATNRLLLAARELPEVETVAALAVAPYSTNNEISNYLIHGRSAQFDRNEVTDDYKDVMKLTLMSGRWFSREDVGTGDRPVVINERLARQLFGREDALGKILAESSEGRPAERVIGIITDFRVRGELSGPGNYAFFQTRLDDTPRPPGNLATAFARDPARSRRAHETLRASKGCSFRSRPSRRCANDARPSARPSCRVPRRGLPDAHGRARADGVLWQNVTQRTREIGLRRAKGATGGTSTFRSSASYSSSRRSGWRSEARSRSSSLFSSARLREPLGLCLSFAIRCSPCTS